MKQCFIEKKLLKDEYSYLNWEISQWFVSNNQIHIMVKENLKKIIVNGDMEVIIWMNTR